MRTSLVTALAFGVTLCGCSGENAPNPSGPASPAETISAPTAPSGPAIVSLNVEATYTSGGAISSLGHSLEYRFDFDASGAHDYSAWGATTLGRKTWAASGIRDIRVQARCATHTSVLSSWSASRIAEVGAGPETEITSVINTYYTGSTKFVESIDFTDGVPDTVPYGSWVTVYYVGTPTAAGATVCPNIDDACLRYQFQYTRESVMVPSSSGTIAWRPYTAEDTNPNSRADSISMNVGSFEYTMRARAVDQYNRADLTPPEIQIVGNFDPTLDSYAISNYDGTAIAPGDTAYWDWWQPANSPDTLDMSNPTDPFAEKVFYIRINATGHDHPKERQGAGVKSWYYEFRRHDTGSIQPVGRSGVWTDGVSVNVFDHQAMVTFRYSLANDPGGANVLANLPGYLNHDLDFTIQGRDLGSADVFLQYVWNSGIKELLNVFLIQDMARRTSIRTQSLHVKLTH